MSIDQKYLVVSIADLNLKVTSNSRRIKFDVNSSVKHYCTNFSESIDFCIDYDICLETVAGVQEWSFVGKPESNEYLNYSWYVKYARERIVIKVDFIDHEAVEQIVTVISTTSKNIQIQVIPKNGSFSEIEIDPLIHPLGSLLLLYLVHLKGGLLMHAAAVVDNCKAFLFTGVSGIGKSTMARLWKECGAKVINDDRVVLRLQGDEVMVYNNPMPYYRQYPVQSCLRKIFLLKQASENYLKPLRGVEAYSRVMGNFIQQFYDKDLVTQHLEYIERVLSKVEVYELGFKPDHDVVKMIREME